MLKKLIDKWLCLHKWKELYKTQVYSAKQKVLDLPESYEVTLVCRKCGEIKKIKI